jgi:hypothetical protein
MVGRHDVIRSNGTAVIEACILIDEEAIVSGRALFPPREIGNGRGREIEIDQRPLQRCI